MGEFKGQGLVDEYDRVLRSIYGLASKIRFEIIRQMGENADADNLTYLYEAETRLYKILADDLGITREDLWNG